MTTQEILQRAKQVRSAVAGLSTALRHAGLLAMAEALDGARGSILEANLADVAAAQNTLSAAMIDRLTLTDARIDGMIESIRVLAEQPDPVGRVLADFTRPNGLNIQKISVPFGVIAIIYESRPNVTADAAALAFASGNACVLRCGKEAWRSARAIVDAMQCGLRRLSLPEDAVLLIEDTTRQSAAELMHAEGFVDVLIPRGGKTLIDRCVREATVPCIQTGTGICHVYVDGAADLAMAVRIVENAKTSRPSVCNAAEVCLVDRAIADRFLPMLYTALVTDRAGRGLPPVELRLDPAAAVCIQGTPAGAADFDTEFLDYILAVKVVDGVEEAIAHISAHSTGHSDAIVTADEATACRFVAAVDSAAVYVNASTRFTDGGEFGFGGEMGIATQKLHARGPIGLPELTTYKYVITGQGQIR